MTSVELLTIAIIFLGSLIQGIAGFGFALVVMPVLSGLTSIYVAAPLVAMGTLANNTVMWAYYRRSCDRTIVFRLLLGSVLGMPLGFLALQWIPASWTLTGLGVLIVVYSLYALINPVLPKLASSRWIYTAGFLSGILMGGYNLPGPPVALYGNSQRWPQATFKSNLTSFFWFNAVFVIVGHSLQHRISGDIIHQFLIALPALFIGLGTGISLARFVDPLWFRRVVLGLLIVIGCRLIIVGVGL